MAEIGTTGEAGGAATQGAGVFMGEGLPPIPARLAERIQCWEFVEMFELLPELLVDHKVGDSTE